MWILLLLLSLVVLCAYWALTAKYEYWKRRGVPSPPVSILFGNLGESLSMKKSVGEIYTDIYNAFPDYLYVGFYKIRQPGLVLRDPELIKNVLVKEFSKFHDNDIEIDEKVDPIAAKSTFTAKGDKWKVLKAQLTPCFTSKKLKAMYPLVEDATKKLINYLNNELGATGPDGLDSKELCAKYSTEVVASCAFGLEARSFIESNSEFRRFGKKIFHPSPGTIIKFLILMVFPSFSKILKVKFFPDDVIGYFRNIVKEALKYRDENKMVRNDFLDFMKDLKSKLGEEEFDDDDILGHALGFFTDGFETTSSVISYAFFELASNSDAQDKLRIEIQRTLKQCGGKLDYDSLHAMPYLDAVVNETLRMHPPGLVLLRSCTTASSFPAPKGIGTGPEIQLEIGTPIIIPLYGLQMDPDYFPDPERFDPDRFAEENKEHITKGTFMPFGEGPRGCHGQRFGIMQTKAAIASVVANFEIRVNNKTKLPLRMDPTTLIPQPIGGIWLNFIKQHATVES